MESLPLNSRTALITGGAQGLGKATALRLAEEGCTGIMVADLNKAAAEETASEIRQSTEARAIAVHMDITDPGSVENGVALCATEFPQIDILVSNAGILVSGDIDTFSPDDWKRVMDVNLYGYFLIAKYVSPIMKKQKSGVIVQINSKSGKKGSFKNSAYCASKFGGIGLTQSLALELAEFGIRVNSVCPGNLLDSPLWTESLFRQYAKRWGISEDEVRKKYVDQVPLGRGCAYDDVTNLVVFLASDYSSYMTGQAVNVTGGQEMR